MAWYDEAIFYHIYPLGLTGAPAQNDGSAAGRRLNMRFAGGPQGPSSPPYLHR